MKRNEAITRLKAHSDAVRAMGATSLYLYGSTARDDGGDPGDIDLYIDYDPMSRFNAFDLIGIKQFLEAQLGSAVDLTTRDGLHPMLRDRIEESATRVF